MIHGLDLFHVYRVILPDFYQVKGDVGKAPAKAGME